MAIINFEFKARVADLAAMEIKLLGLNPEFIGEDHQVDTYFNINNGRLKLREGNIENALIWYERADTAGPKTSRVLLYQHTPNSMLKEILVKVHGIKVIVRKKRKIYFIGHVKFHFDSILDLGTFIEVEAIDKTGDTGIKRLQEDCEKYASLFGLRSEDYIACSYSDMLIKKMPGT